MHRKSLICLAIVVFYMNLILYSFCFADAIYFKNSKKVECRILKKSDKYVSVEVTEDGQKLLKMYPIEQIDHIEEGEKVIPAETVVKEAIKGFEQNERIGFTIPAKWIQMQAGREKGFYSFLTDKDPAKRLMVLVCVFKVPDQTALEWTIDEQKGQEKKGIQILGEAAEINIGDQTWCILKSKTIAKSEDGRTAPIIAEQYFKKGQYGSMTEVGFSGYETVFKNIDREEINEFLLSVKFDTRTLEEAKASAYSEHIVKMLDKEIPKHKKGDIVKGYLAIDIDKSPPRVGVILKSEFGNPLYTEVTTLIDGQTIFGGALSDQKFKILSIKKVNSGMRNNEPYGKKEVNYFEVQAEMIE